jgi:hypothetical protein
MSAPQSSPKPVSLKAKKAHPHSAKRPKRWYALTIVAAACAAIVYLGLNWQLGSAPQRVTERPAPSAEAGESRTGKIVLQTNPDHCAEMKFDNSDGRFVDGLKPCDNQIKFDEHGRPIPMGTIHRLDAISRSSFGR